MTLVDSSVWVDHLRQSNARLVGLLEVGQVACHPFVIGEIALGSLKQRALVLDLLAELPASSVVSHDEVLALVDRRRLSGRGIGWIDAHLLASAIVERASLWTLDRRLAAVARDLGLAA